MIKIRWGKWLIATAVFISFLMHFRHFSKDLMSIHVWRQTQTQATINSFYEEDFTILNPKRDERGETEGLFRMEFPLMQWLVASGYHVFGKSIILTRITMFLLGICSMLGLYYLMKTVLKSEMSAVVASWTLAFSPCFYYYTINPMPDNLSLATAIWGLVFFFKWQEHQNLSYAIGASLLFSIASLCKLPFVLYYILPTIYFVLNFRNIYKKRYLIEAFVFFIPFLGPVLWYLWVIPTWGGNMILKGVTDNQVAWTELFHYAVHTFCSTLPELLINYGAVLFFLVGCYSFIKNKKYKNQYFKYLLGLLLLLLCYYFYEINAIADVHDYYLFPFYPLISVVVSYGAFQLHSYGQKGRWISYLMLISIPVLCFLRMQVRWNPTAPGFNKDLLTYQKDLRAAVPDDALVVAGNDISHFIFFYYIDKKGWGFHDNNLNASDLKEMINKGAKYLYLDDTQLLENDSLFKLTDSLVLKKGSIEVYKLRAQ